MAKENNVLSWQNRHLTLQSIESYNSRKLSELDMHKAERHILNCDLCAEALEGYGQKTGDPKVRKNLETLRLQIRQKSEGQEKSGSKFKTWGVAASIVIFLGVGLYYLQGSFLPISDEPEIAMKKEQSIEKPAQEQLIVDDQKPADEELAVVEDPTVTDPDAAENTIRAQAPVATPALRRSVDPQSDQDLAASSDEAADIVENEVAFAVEEESSTDGDELLTVGSAEAVFSEAPQTDVAPLSEENLEEAKKTTVELAKSGTAEGGPQLVTSTSLSSGAKLGGSIMDSDPEPEIGFEDYAVYLQNSLQYPEEARLNNIYGIVKIGFILKPGSSYSKFRIVEGLGYGCDKEAERLIQEGPNWKPAIRKGLATKEEVIVEVKFE